MVSGARTAENLNQIDQRGVFSVIFVADFGSLAQELFLCLKLFTSDSASQHE